MVKFYHVSTLIVTWIVIVNILEANGTHEPFHHQLVPLPVPVPVTEDQLTWKNRVLNAIPSNLSYHNKLKNGEVLVSDICNQHFLLYEEALGNLTTWALQMFDASTKIPDGVSYGSTTDLGNFDQCLAIKAYDENDQYVFKGHYCGTYISLSSPIYSVGVQIASCFPSTCTHEDLAQLIQTQLGEALAPIGVGVGVGISPDNCYIEGDKPPIDSTGWVVIYVVIVLASVVVVCTIFDAVNVKIGIEKVDSTIKSFSLFENMNNLMKIEHGKGTIQCMHGIRVGSIFWVILGHRYGMQNGAPRINPSAVGEIYNDLSMQLIMNAMPAVDTFFFMSGFLVCYLFMKDLSKGNKFNPIIYYVHRYLRLSTSYALMLAFYTTLFDDVGYGPRWRPNVNFMTQICKETWWTGLLYVDNFVLMENYDNAGILSICISQGWYLTVDMQFAWVAPLVLIPLYYWPKWSIQALLLLILTACFAPFTSTYLNKFYMTNVQFYDPQVYKYETELYRASYMRAAPYLLGIALAYFMYKKPKGIKMPKWLVACGWISITAIAFTVILYPSVMYQPGFEYDVVSASFYAGFHRAAWSAVIGWIIFACHYGYGGPINWILSQGCWLPISKLSYTMFLVHFYVLYYDLNQIKSLFYFSHFSIIQKFFGDIFYSALLGLVIHLLVEAPTLGLLKTFIKKPAPITRKSEEAMKSPL